MENATKKRVTGVLVAPVLSLTILCTGHDAAFADNHSFIDKFFATGKAKTNEVEQATLAMQPRLTQLEQAVRDLTMQVETLQFTLLQMQNRLDVLEGRSPTHSHIEATHTPMPESAASASESAAAESIIPINAAQIFGSMRFEDKNYLQDSAMPETDDPQEFYKIGYQYILSGDYPAAERIFRTFLENFPDDAQIADASFWLGESLYAQGHYREAAQIYIDVQRQHQNSSHGPENLLKLGLSMAQLQEKEVACKTLTEVPKRYAQVEPAVLKRVNDEKSRLGCS